MQTQKTLQLLHSFRIQSSLFTSKLWFAPRAYSCLKLSRCANVLNSFKQNHGIPRLFTTNEKGMTGSVLSETTNTSGSEPEAYRAGLQKTAFTHECKFINESQVIPIFRIMGYDGQLKEGWACPFTLEECVKLYEFMVRLSVYDLLFYNIQRQGRISFYMQNQGEEAMQTGIGNALEKDDMLWCQYRELGVLMWRGLTPDDALNQLFGTSGDPGLGRQMPISYTKKEIGLQTICTPLTTQLPHAAGAGYAFKLADQDRVSVAFFGEGAASEGDFHAAMNFAAVHQAQTLFICRNNGYAISTPVSQQYAGDGIAARGVAYGMHTIRADGNDFFAAYIATKEARRLCVEKKVPVCLEFMTYRAGHHSTSDDSSQYRPANEMALWKKAGLDGIDRMRLFLQKHQMWDEEKEATLRKEAKQFILNCIKRAEKRKTVPILYGMFHKVYDENPWNIKEQEAELRAHIERYAEHYPMQQHPGI